MYFSVDTHPATILIFPLVGPSFMFLVFLFTHLLCTGTFFMLVAQPNPFVNCGKELCFYGFAPKCFASGLHSVLPLFVLLERGCRRLVGAIKIKM